MLEVEASNRMAIQIKHDRKIQEQEVENNIAEYQRKKIAAEEQRVREARKIADEKEREIQRLREMQEKAQDRQAQMDEVKAKKAYEESEKLCRQKEAEDRRKL